MTDAARSTNTTLARIRQSATERGLALPPGDDDDLATTLDSFARVELIEIIEDAFGVRVRPRDATAENFGSVTKIARYLDGIAKRGAS